VEDPCTTAGLSVPLCFKLLEASESDINLGLSTKDLDGAAEK